MPVLKMLEDKTLIITKSGNTYHCESNAEIIQLILPKTINNIDLGECTIHLSFVNQKNLGKDLDVTNLLTDYTDKYYCIETSINSDFTQEAGIIKIWIELFNGEKNMIAKTNEVCYPIKEHTKVEEIITEEGISILESMVLKLDSIEKKIDEVSNKVQKIVEGEKQIVQPMLIGTVRDENAE